MAGLALMLGFCMLVPLSEAYAKQAAMASVPIVVITFARFLGQSVDDGAVRGASRVDMADASGAVGASSSCAACSTR